MAVSSKIEEILLEITKNIGNISDYLVYGIGDQEKPGSAIFELNNLRTVAETGYPYFGIVESSNPGFTASYDFSTDQYNVNFGSATVSYNGSLINIIEQKIPIKKEFLKDYSLISPNADNYKYGITIGFSLDEAKKAIQTFNTTVSSISSVGSTVLYVNQSSIASTLGFPLEAQIGTSLIKFIGFNNDKTGLYVSPSYWNGAGYGTLPATYDVDAAVKFIFQPSLSYITGFPIETENDDPEAFNYYPPIPNDWLSVAKILVKRPDNPRVAGASYNSIIRTVNDIPTNTSSNLILGDGDDKSEVINSCIAAINNLNIYRNDYGLNYFINGLVQYTSSLGNTDNLSFNAFWALQPFRKTQYYSKGVSFSGLERFEFPYNFTKAFYKNTSYDPQHTYAVFRGDLITNNVSVLSSASIGSTNITITAESTNSTLSSLKPGNQIYGISAVVNISGDQYSETVPSYKSISSIDTTNGNYFSDINWSGNGVTNALFYNIYKRSETYSEVMEKKLTNPNEIIYQPKLSGSLNSNNSEYTLSQRTTAFKFNVSENAFLGGIGIYLGYTAGTEAATGNSKLSFSVYGDTSNSPDINKQKSSGTTLNYSDISSGSNEYLIKFNNGFNALSSENYWLVIHRPADFTTGSGVTSLKVKIDSTVSNSLLYSNVDFASISSWSTDSGGLYLKYKGFVDNGNIIGSSTQRGIKLTNRIANTARRLSVYVPNVDDIIDDTGLFFNGSSVAIAATTDKTIKNDLVVYVTAKNGIGGTEVTLFTTVPQGTNRNTRFLLGSDTDIFDRVTNVSVLPGTNLRRINNGSIMWDIYDLITVETEP